jgi:hypothetical protein
VSTNRIATVRLGSLSVFSRDARKHAGKPAFAQLMEFAPMKETDLEAAGRHLVEEVRHRAMLEHGPDPSDVATVAHSVHGHSVLHWAFVGILR